MLTEQKLAEMEADAARVAALLRDNLDTLSILIRRETSCEP